MILTFLSLCIDAGVIPPGSPAFPYFLSIQNGLASGLITCLMINGFVGFQLYEDGTPLSLWMLRLCSSAAFAITFLVSIATFKGWAGLGPTNTIGLFIVLYIVNGVELVVFVALQILLVVRTLQDRWPLGDIAFGVFFFVIGQVILYAFSSPLCTAVSHYLDGLFFATTCNLLGIMMVYKVRVVISSHAFCRMQHRFCSPLVPRPADRRNFSLNAVLGLHHQGRPRVFGEHENEQLGGKGTSSRGGATRHGLHRRPLRPLECLRPPILADTHGEPVFEILSQPFSKIG